jgi:acyl-coenzyme A synthetase/AMP-(fatty) acid ligase
MDHPAVAQVVCFGMPHDKLGEEVAAVVVLREGQSATERELQAFVAQRAAEFKVPKKILLMDEIPKGATGKLQRIGLAAKLGLA